MFKQLTAALTALTIATTASAGVTYGFTHVFEVGDGPTELADAAIGEAQLSVEVKDTAGQVEFLFKNAGPEASSMVQLYWEDNAGVLSTTNPGTAVSFSPPTPGVNFSGGTASPGHLPGISPPSTFDDYSIEAASGQGGKQPNGVGPNEEVSIFFNYTGTYLAVLEAIDNGQLHIGTHVQGYRSGGSESFVVTGTVIPSPTAALAGLALLGVIVSRRRRD